MFAVCFFIYSIFLCFFLFLFFYQKRFVNKCFFQHSYATNGISFMLYIYSHRKRKKNEEEKSLTDCSTSMSQFICVCVKVYGWGWGCVCVFGMLPCINWQVYFKNLLFRRCHSFYRITNSISNEFCGVCFIYLFFYFFLRSSFIFSLWNFLYVKRFCCAPFHFLN